MPTSEARSINANPSFGAAALAFTRLGRLTLKAAPGRIALLGGLQVAKDVASLAMIAATASFVDRVVDGRPGGGALTTMLVLGALSQGIGWSVFGLGQGVRERVAHLMEQAVIDLVASIPTIEHHERAEFQNEVTLMRYQAVWLGGIANRVVDLVGAAVRVAGTLLLLASVHPALLALAAAGLPAVLGARAQSRLQQRVTEAVVERRRMADALLEVGTSASPAKEVRVFALAPVLEERLERLHEGIDAELDAASRRSAALDVAVQLTFGACFAVALAAVAVLAARGQRSPGEVLLTAALAVQITGHLASASSSVGPLRDAAVAAHRFRWLQSYAADITARTTPPAPAAVPVRLERGLRIDGVSFKYPDSDRLVLDNVSLDLPASATVALVGENGAGKTTLVKLLLRMYLPTAGRLLVDDVDLADLDPVDWRQRTSAAFQDHARFEVLLRESIGVSRPEEMDREDALVDALDRATGADLLDVVELDRQLGRMFRGGVELSIGQWQKVSLARGLLRSAPLLLTLDEPTSALDPLAEQRLFEGFALAARNAATNSRGVTLLVSHRFSTVRTADLIAVLRHGRIEELGTHHELMTRRGIYHELYELQARSYR